MNGAGDIRPLLEAWPYDPVKNARVTRLDDGREVLQVRLPMGIEQYEMEGRPDGKRPHGMECSLDYYMSRLARLQATGKAHEFRLDPRACQELYAEGVLYYYRYLHLFQLQDWERTIRDTTRNLTLSDFVHQYAAEARDRKYLEQWRPYVTRMHAVASALAEVKRERHLKALRIVHAAEAAIRDMPEMDDESFRAERQRSLEILGQMATQIDKSRPLTEEERLDTELRKAVELEQFERAAELRDRLRLLRLTQPHAAGKA